MKPLYQTKLRTTDDKIDHAAIEGLVEKAHPHLIPTTETVRWRPPGCSSNEAHVGHVYLDNSLVGGDGPYRSQEPLKVVVDARTWDVYHVQSIERVNDQNRTDLEEAEWEKGRPAREEAERALAAQRASTDDVQQLKDRIASLEARLAALEEKIDPKPAVVSDEHAKE